MPTESAPKFYRRLEAAVILGGLVRLQLDDDLLEIEPRNWYQQAGTHYLEATRRDSGEQLVLRADQIRDVMAY